MGRDRCTRWGARVLDGMQRRYRSRQGRGQQDRRPGTTRRVSICRAGRCRRSNRHPNDLLPYGETPVPVERVRWRSGFSPVQTTVLDPEQVLDRTTLPPPVGSGSPDGVALVDLTTGERIPALVELDAWPDNPETPRLLVRPLEPMHPGHRVAVSVSSDVRTVDDEAYAGPTWFQHARTGMAVEGSTAQHYDELARSIEALGLPSPALAVDFPIGDGRLPLQSVIDALPSATDWEWLRVFDAEDGESLPDGAWIQAEGRFTTADWLVDDGMFAPDSDGHPQLQGEVEADLFVFIPDTVRDAAPGTAPVWIFGHGIFSHPSNYLANPDDPSGVIAVAREAGAIVLGTTWRGLTRSDIPVAAAVGATLAASPSLPTSWCRGWPTPLRSPAWWHTATCSQTPSSKERPTPKPSATTASAWAASRGLRCSRSTTPFRTVCFTWEERAGPRCWSARATGASSSS